MAAKQPAQQTDTRPGTAQSTAAGSEAKAGAQAFFTHSLPPYPDTTPPFFVRLFDEHLAALTATEAELVFDDFIAYSRSLASLPPTEQVAPFQSNDVMQAAMDLPLSAFNTGAPKEEGWEKRRAALRAYSQTFFQRSVTVVAANIQHAAVQSAAGFKRRCDIGGGPSFTSEGDGLYLHVWRSSSQARFFLDCLKGLQQCIFDHHVRSVRAPVASAFLYRGIIFTVCAAIPVCGQFPEGLSKPVTWGPTQPPTVDSCAVARLDVPILLAALGRHFCGAAHVDGALPSATSLGLERALDGRLYVTSFKWRTNNMSFALTDFPANIDANVWVRPEAPATMDEAMRQRIRREYCDAGRTPKSNAGSSTRRHLMDTVVPVVAKELFAASSAAEGALATLFKDSVVSKTFHRYGLPMRCLYAVLDVGYLKVPNPEKRAQGPAYKGLKEMLELEMVNRTVKQMVRLEMRASPGEDAAAHVGRVNRLYASLAQKTSGVWADHMHPILRRKYDAPEDYTIGLTSVLFKLMAAYGSSRLGCSYDKATNKFTNFTAIHQYTTVFGLPYDVQRCIPGKDGYSSNGSPPPTLGSSPSFVMTQSMRVDSGLAGSNSMANFEDSASPNNASPLASKASVRFAPGALTSPTHGPAKPGEATAPVAGKEELQIDVTARHQRVMELELAWQSVVVESTGADITGVFGKSPAPAEEHIVLDPVALSSLMRIMVMLRILGAASFDQKRKELYAGITHHTKQAPLACWDPCVALQLRLHGMMDGMRMSDADVINDAIAAIVERLGKRVADDAVHLGRLRVLASRVNGNIPAVVAGTKLFRSATWCDVSMLNEYFTNLMTASASLNVNSDTATLAEVYRLANRVCRRQDVTARRAALITSLRKTSGALVASQTQASCFGLRDAMEEALRHHVDRFGPADIQTSVVYAQVVYIFVASHQSQLNDKQLVDVRKFHYQVSSMGTQSLDAMKSVISSEQYTASLAAMLHILSDLGDTVLAEKALTQAAGSIGDLDNRGVRMAATVLHLQTGAAGRLQRMVRMATKIGPEHLIKRAHFEDRAYRQGLEVVEMDERHALARLELFERWQTPRPSVFVFEDREFKRALWFGARKIYIVPPELLEKPSALIAQEEDLHRRDIVTPEDAERVALEELFIKFNEMVIRMIARRDDFVFSETKRRAEFDFEYKLAVARLEFCGRESFTRALVQARLHVEFVETLARLKVRLVHSESLAALVDRLTLEGDSIRAFVLARERIIKGEDANRTRLLREHADELQKACDDCRTGGLALAKSQLDAAVVSEVQARMLLTQDEEREFRNISHAYHISGDGVSGFIAAKLQMADDEQTARYHLIGYELSVKHILRCHFDQDMHRLIIRESALSGLATMYHDGTLEKDRIHVADQEAHARRRTLHEEGEDRESLVRARDDGNERNRAATEARRAVERQEALAREHLSDELLAEAWLVFRTEFARSYSVAEYKQKEREALWLEERQQRRAVQDELIQGCFVGVEHAERYLVAASEELEWKELMHAATDPEALAAVRKAVQEREAREFGEIDRARRLREQHEREVTAHFAAEDDERAQIITAWIDSAREGASAMRAVLRALMHFYLMEPKKRDGVAEAETNARSRIANTYRSETKAIQQQEIARKRASERNTLGPLRALHGAIKTERVAELRQEEATISSLVRLVRETESVKQKIVHDKVAAVHSRLPELREEARLQKAADRKERRLEVDALIATTSAIQEAQVQRAAEMHRKEKAEAQRRLEAKKREIAERVKVARAEVEHACAMSRQEAIQRRQLVEKDAEEKEAVHTKLLAGRPVFSIVQSRADAIAEREEITRITKREKEILAAIRYLELQDEMAAANERQLQTRAKTLVDAIAKEALFEMKAEDAKETAAEVRAERSARLQGASAAVEVRRSEHKERRHAHSASMVAAEEARRLAQEQRGAEIAQTLHEARLDVQRQEELDAQLAKQLRDHKALVAHQRVECTLVHMKHARVEEGHLVKSPVKSPQVLRHLPPIQFEHSRMLHHQARLLQSHLAIRAESAPPPALALSPVRANASSPPASQTPPPESSMIMNDAA